MDFDLGRAIPHRPPFLLLDEVVELSSEALTAAATLRPDDELWSRIYAGHYPGNPITPGVLLLEMLFQAAAALLSGTGAGGENAMPVVTRIQDAKFRRMVLPGDSLLVRVELSERISNAFFMKGKVEKNGKTAAEARFAVAWAAVAKEDGL